MAFASAALAAVFYQQHQPDTSVPPLIHVPPLDLSRPRRLHIVGVGGVGMSAIALLLAGAWEWGGKWKLLS